MARPTRTLVALLAVAALAAGCSDDGDDDTPRTLSISARVTGW